MTAAGWPGVRPLRRAAEWGKQKYAGSLAEEVWRRLDALDFVNRGMMFAATLLLCLFPFLIVVSALAGRPVADSLARFTGLDGEAAADVGHLFASSAATASAVVGTASMVFFVFGGIAAAAALQDIYERAFELPHRRVKDVLHRLAWLAVLIGTSLLTGWAAPGLRQAGGPALLAAAGLAWATGFWWLTMAILLAGRISSRALFPAACATGMLYLAMQAVFSVFFSAMVISDDTRYGPIGVIFALLSYLIAIGVVVILGAVVGLAWRQRRSGNSQAGRLLPPSGHRGGPDDRQHQRGVTLRSQCQSASASKQPPIRVPATVVRMLHACPHARDNSSRTAHVLSVTQAVRSAIGSHGLQPRRSDRRSRPPGLLRERQPELKLDVVPVAKRYQGPER